MGLSLAEELDKLGYLTVNKLTMYLKAYHPIVSVSYPVINKYVKAGKIKSVKAGEHYRIPKASIEHFIEHGPLQVEEGGNSLSSTDLGGMPAWLDTPPPDVSHMPMSRPKMQPTDTFIDED